MDRQIGAAVVLYRNGVLKRKGRMRLGSARHHMVFKGEEVGLILGIELIREEELADGMVLIGIDNVAVISATLMIKPSSSHYIWDIFHKRVAMACKKT